MSKFLFLAHLSIPAEFDAEFNRLYDTAYIPELLKTPGAVGSTRYRLEWADFDTADYLAAHVLESSDVPNSPTWRNASAVTGWAAGIRPHLTVRRHAMYRKLGPDR